MQFYAPGFAPFVDNESCDNTHWCASLHINDLECTLGFQSCNNNCIEPTNFAFIQTNGVPTGPPSPQLATAASFTPNENTLLMNPGDRLKIHIWDARLPGGGHALETSIKDMTTGKSGFMIASARNGFMQTSIADCSGTPFNYQPEYSTAKKANIIPWAALETNISTQFEIGHFEPCTSVQNPMPITLGTFHDTIWQDCTSPYESTTMPDGKPNPELSDAPCWPKGFTHGGQAPPNLVAGCIQTIAQNGDLDFDGTSYWADWPSKTTPNNWPSPFLQMQPQTRGHGYPRIQFQTNAAASEASCKPDRRRLRGASAGRSREVLPVVDAGQGERRMRLGVRPDAKRQHLRQDPSVRRPVGVLLREPGGPDQAEPELLSTHATSHRGLAPVGGG